MLIQYCPDISQYNGYPDDLDIIVLDAPSKNAKLAVVKLDTSPCENLGKN